MNRVTIINLAGRALYVENDGVEAIDRWMEAARATLQGDPDRDELLADFEQAIAEWRPLPTPEDIVLSEEQRDGLIAAVDGLEPELRATIILADLEELPQREVATMLDIPEGTVASRLFRARRKLRSALDATTGSARGWRAG